MRLLITCIFILAAAACSGQGFNYPKVNQAGNSIKEFVPRGWLLLDSATGDLDNDKLADAVIVLQYKDSIQLIKAGEDTVITQPRMMIILFKTAGGYSLAEQNNSFILNHDNPIMDDPYEEIKIYKGILGIKFHLFYSMGSWYTSSSTYKFRYRNKQFILIGADYFSIHRASLDFEEYSYNFLTKKRSLTKGNDEKHIKKLSWKPINITTLKTLSSFKQPYTWEVEPDIYL